jgi:hypothetical protein
MPYLIATQLELLAHHLTGGAKAERAVEQWLNATPYPLPKKPKVTWSRATTNIPGRVRA